MKPLISQVNWFLIFSAMPIPGRLMAIPLSSSKIEASEKKQRQLK